FPDWTVACAFSNFFVFGMCRFVFPDEFAATKLDIAKMAVESSRKQNVYMAKLAGRAGRHEEMLKFIKTAAQSVDVEELTLVELNLLLVAYETVTEARWASWNAVYSVELEEDNKGSEHVGMILMYRSKIESELDKIYSGILKVLWSLIPVDIATQVYYLIPSVFSLVEYKGQIASYKVSRTAQYQKLRKLKSYEEIKKLLQLLQSDDCVYLATLAILAKRDEDMVGFMEEVTKRRDCVNKGWGLTTNERYLLCLAYKNVISARMASWRSISFIERVKKGKVQASLLTETYKRKIGADLSRFCTRILHHLMSNYYISALSGKSKDIYGRVLDEHMGNPESNAETDLMKICDSILEVLETQFLTHLTSSGSSQYIELFFSQYFDLTRNNDYHRFLAECSTGAELEMASGISREVKIHGQVGL
ncbi:hypothetical protein IFM89_017605, partial [Coptis chinensis]